MSVVDIKSLLDPELLPAVETVPPLVLSHEALPTLRAGFGSPVELSDRVVRSVHKVPGDPPVMVRVHRPADATEPLPCVYSMHSGGYVLGSAAVDDATFDRLVPLLGIVGVSVDYRLAPETPYPGPLEDCYAGLRWTFEHAAELGINPSWIGVRGISGGGGLAAGLALLARDRGELRLGFQLLDCPMIDDRQQTPSSRMDDLPIWPREANEFGWRSYLGELYGTENVPYYAAAARAEDLSGLPPTFVAVGSVDGFRDENIDYALRLNQAGVPTELHVYAGAFHGHKLAKDSSIARQSQNDIDAWLGRQIDRLKREA